MGDLFKKGYGANREEKARQERMKENMGKRLYRFFLSGDGAEADLIFLTEEPITFHEHNIKTIKNGKETFYQYTCTGDDCELCEDGDRPSFKGAFLVYDKRPYEYEDKNGKKQKVDGSIRLFVYGTKIISQLDRISSKYGLAGRDITMVRLGTGTATSYTFEKGDKVQLTEKEIRNLLPEKLREDYDGTEDSLYKIVEQQLLMGAKDYREEVNDNDDEDGDEIDTESSSKVIDLEDDDEEERPKKKLGKSKLGAKKTLFKSKGENSLKKPQNKAKALLKKRK